MTPITASPYVAISIFLPVVVATAVAPEAALAVEEGREVGGGCKHSSSILTIGVVVVMVAAAVIL